MTITSRGYDGSVNESDWASLSELVGVDNAVDTVRATAGDFRVRIAGTGTRPVTVAPGKAFGSGVLDTNSADAVLNPAALASGTRWDTVVIDRNWSTNTSALAIRSGTSAKQITLTNTTPGTHEDQPLALILLDSAFSAVQQVIDLRGQADKIRTLVSAEAIQLLPKYGWAYALDTKRLWHAEDVAGTPTWVDTTDPVWTAITLPGSRAAFGTAPAWAVVNGVLYLRGAWQQNPTGSNFNDGTTYSLGTLPAGARPGVDTSFTVDHGFIAGSIGCRITCTTAGVLTAVCSGPTNIIRSENVRFPVEN